jgi:Zn-finger nucleic acid-binding protein
MSACPFCFTEMRPTLAKGLAREECEPCGALWLQGEMLEKVIGHGATDTLLRQAKGRPGQCKGCPEQLQYVPSCPGCGRRSPTCPQCGNAPLPVSEVHGVKVDVCVGCRAIGLDAGELERLDEASKGDRFLELSLKPEVKQAASAPLTCATCRRSLKPQHAFACESQLYCGSCAPSESAPYQAELTRGSPSMDPTFGTQASTKLGLLRAAGEPITGGLTWLFSKILG